jgi:hypothetical protein
MVEKMDKIAHSLDNVTKKGEPPAGDRLRKLSAELLKALERWGC